MAEWVCEEGIGERRLILANGDNICAAKIELAGELRAGQQFAGRVTTRYAGTHRGIAKLESGVEALVDHLPREATEGATGQFVISRAPIAERGRLKMAQARWLDPSKSQADEGVAARTVSAFPAGCWEEVWHAASSGSISFPGGEIICSVTPAMTVIDIDGDLPAKSLAMASLPAIAQAIRWFDLGGNIGIDFPTLSTKSERLEVDHALADALRDWPHERTAMNGFGFVQIVARLEGPSLLHRFATSRTGLCARYALRTAQRARGTGPTLLLTVHPALKAKLKPEWLDELARRTGKQVRIETEPTLALEAPHAQILSE